MLYRLKNLGIPAYNPIDVGYDSTSAGHAYGPAVRNYYLLHYVLYGKGIFVHGDNTYALSDGQCFVIRPHELTYYKADENEPWHYIWVGFRADSIPLCIETQDVLDIPFASPIFEEIEKNLTYYNSEAGDGGKREAYLSSKIAELMAQLHIAFLCPAESKTQSDMKIIKNYIDTHYTLQLSISELAERFHLSASYFSRQFKKALGSSPQGYIVKKRLNEAARLMTVHGFTPSAAASTVGYTDIYLFSKMFKRLFGISPREYKKTNS